MKKQAKGPKFRVALSRAEAEHLRDLLKEDHDYEYTQGGCLMCKLHKRLVAMLTAREAGPARGRKTR